jgi:Kef-type K+ transport system membrane component KefB/mannitol/fructose-specific phosphotransferase system IIA component
MSHSELTAFFLALGLMLLVARVLGELARRLNTPAVLGELFAGVLLGPSVLGALSPELFAGLFPATPGFAVGLEAVTTLGITLFLMVAGIEVDLSAILRQGKASFVISLFGMFIPFAIGFGSAMLLPTLFVRETAADPLLVALFLGTALSITALPVIAKILIDLNMFRSDLGMILIAVAVINDIVGWLLFATILGTLQGAGGEPNIWMIVGMTVGFAILMLTVGRFIIDAILPPLQAYTSWPGGVLGFAVTGGLLAAALTEWIGIHAILGAFMFGVAFGDSTHLREKTRQILDHFISFIFAPLFFASIGLRVDVFAHFDLVLVVVVLLIATAGKMLGSILASKLMGFSRRESIAIGFGMNARGAMEIILGLLALQAGLIGERLFVALIVMAMVTSLVAGPAMQWIMGRRKVSRLVDFLSAKAFLPQLHSRTRDGVIAELAAVLAQTTGLPHADITGKVMEREKTMPTGIGRRAAIPHARIEGLTSPAIAVGYSKDGIDFDAPDGQPARLIFLVLTPKDEFQRQLQILAEIGRLLRSDQAVERILRSQSFVALRALINSEEKAHAVPD